MGFFLLTGNTGLWIKFPQTGIFSWGSAGCRFFNKAMSLLDLFLRGYITFASSEYRAAHPIVYHVQYPAEKSERPTVAFNS